MSSVLSISTSIIATSLSTRKPLGSFDYHVDLEEQQYLITRFQLPANIKNVSNQFTNAESLTQVFSCTRFVHIMTTYPLDLTFNEANGLNSVFEFSINKHFSATISGRFRLRNPSLVAKPVVSIIVS